MRDIIQPYTDGNSHRIAAAPQFPGLQRFPEGRNFKQWTGNDSKALMKVCFLSEIPAWPCAPRSARSLAATCALYSSPNESPSASGEEDSSSEDDSSKLRGLRNVVDAADCKHGKGNKRIMMSGSTYERVKGSHRTYSWTSSFQRPRCQRHPLARRPADDAARRPGGEGCPQSARPDLPARLRTNVSLYLLVLAMKLWLIVVTIGYSQCL